MSASGQTRPVIGQFDSAGGFSLHAGAPLVPHQHQKFERLCRYVSLPPVASERLALTASGQVRYALKTPHRGGTTPIVLDCST